MDVDRFAFRLEYFNELAGVQQPFTLLYVTRRDGRDEVEINDLTHKRRFLSRTHVPTLKLADIIVGGKVTIFSRQYRVVDFEDDFTRRTLGKAKLPYCALLTSAGVSGNALPHVWRAVEQGGMRVSHCCMYTLSPEDVACLASGVDTPLDGGAIIGLCMVGEDSASAWGRIVETLIAAGSISASSVALCTPEHEPRIRAALFGAAEERLPSTRDIAGSMSDCTVACILPTHVRKGQAGDILMELYTRLGIGSGDLTVSALAVFDLDRRTAEDFLEVYKTVLPDFNDVAAEFAAGPMLAMEISGPDAVARVREVVGPREVEVAKRIRADTLRARYGTSPACPAVHCTDLPDDGPLDSEFLFTMVKPR